MLQLLMVAKALEKRLNDELYNAPYELNLFHKNTEYEFKVYADVGEYQKAIKTLNTVHRYINCILRINSDEKAGVTDTSVSAMWSAQLEILVPDALATFDVTEDNETTRVRFVDAVAAYINTLFAASTQEYIRGDDGIVYYLGASYSNTIAGTVDIRHGVAESIPLAVYIEYTVIATGFSSTEFGIYISDDGGADFRRIYPTRMDIMRTSVQEGNIASDSSGVSKVTTQGTVFTIKLTKPYRGDDFDSQLRSYVYDLPFLAHPLLIQVTFPRPMSGNSTTVIPDRKDFYMTFADGAIAAETNLAASCSATLVEVLEI